MDPTATTAPGSSSGLTQTQMVSTLQDLMGNIESKYKEYQTQSAITQNGMALQKSDVLQNLFDLFQTQGVDPSNPQAVRDLLDKVQQNNPDTYRQIEQSLQAILGGDQTPPPVQSSIDTSVASGAMSNTGDSVNVPNTTPSTNIPSRTSPTPVAPMTTPTPTIPTPTPVMGQPTASDTIPSTMPGNSTRDTLNNMRSGGATA